jgi:hypothetical protein
VDKQPDDVYRVIIHGEGKENLFTHTFRFQPSQFWISARYQSNQTGAAAPAGTMGTSDEDSSVGAGEDACAGDDVCPVGESRRVLRSSRTRSRSAKDEGHEAAKPQAASPCGPRLDARRLMQEVKTMKGRLQGSASDEVRRLRPVTPVDDSDDDEARTPRTRSRVGPLGVGPLSAQVSGGGSRRRL